MTKGEKIVLLLGSNIEPRKKFLDKALFLLQQEFGQSISCSSVYESEPWGFDAETNFLNLVALFETEKKPEQVLDICLDTEANLGRERDNQKGYASRTVDIDILYFGEKVIDTEKLTVPHPRLHLRKFTLMPLAETIPQWVHLVLRKTQVELLNDCKDNLKVTLYKEKL